MTIQVARRPALKRSFPTRQRRAKRVYRHRMGASRCDLRRVTSAGTSRSRDARVVTHGLVASAHREDPPEMVSSQSIRALSAQRWCCARAKCWERCRNTRRPRLSRREPPRCGDVEDTGRLRHSFAELDRRLLRRTAAQRRGTLVDEGVVSEVGRRSVVVDPCTTRLPDAVIRDAEKTDRLLLGVGRKSTT